MSRKGLSEKMVYAFNPMPDVPDAEIVRRTGLEMLEPRARSPFYLEWTFSTGLEKEVVPLPPGSFTPFRESEIRAVLLDLRDQGIVRVDDPGNESEVARARADGIRKAHDFFNDRGAKAIARWQKTHGMNADDLAAHAYELEQRFRNRAMAEILREHMAAGARVSEDATASESADRVRGAIAASKSKRRPAAAVAAG